MNAQERDARAGDDADGATKSAKPPEAPRVSELAQRPARRERLGRFDDLF